MSKRMPVQKTRSKVSTPSKDKNLPDYVLEARKILARPDTPDLLEKAVAQGLLSPEAVREFRELAAGVE